MKRIIKLLLSTIIGVLVLSGVSFLTQAASTFPSETNPFVSSYYVEPINQEKPFFEVILPEIAANIKENNKHSISPYYDDFPVLGNPENFQGLGHTTYANINGKTVTAESLYRFNNESKSDPNNGLGLLIYQCIQYKLKHPEEDVKITFSSYRTSCVASVCVIPESKYYGYMRSLYGTNYDEHGFVRISYMLTEAARMGIEVVLVNQLTSYAVSQYDPTKNSRRNRSTLDFKTYYNQALKSDCYEKYAPGKKVSDFMNFTVVDWRVSDKTYDMQHIKSATVSHYLATDGTEHTSAVFFSSSNLDDNNYMACNGNNGTQSGVIISDHDDLYRVTCNFMDVMCKYKGQEDMYKLRKFVNEENERQIELIMEGREDEIADDEQIVYLGSDTDKVFELYFTPVGGSYDNWEPVYNPVCKYVDKLPLSTGYIETIWNEAGFTRCNLSDTMSDIMQKAYCENPDVNNKIHVSAYGYDTTDIRSLALGVEIGYRKINTIGKIHSKDIMLSYEEDGIRHNVSILTSCNFYTAAFFFRTNSILVINETEKTGGNFYNIFADKFSYGMISKNLTVSPKNLTLEPGEKYNITVEDYPGKGTLSWKSSNTSVATVKNGAVTAVKKGSAIITVTDGTYSDTVTLKVVSCKDCLKAKKGITCSVDEQYVVSENLGTTPLTFEAEIILEPESLTGTTTIFGSDGTFNKAVAYTVNKSGQPRVTLRGEDGYKTDKTYTFNKVNVATGEKVHLAIVINPAKKELYCYINGELKQTITGLSVSVPFKDKHNFAVGGDHKSGNSTFFKGTICSVAVWSDIRTSSEISTDYSKGISTKDEKLLAAFDLTACDKCMLKDLSGKGNDLKLNIFWQDKSQVEPVGDFDYSFAVIGDTQTMCRTDGESMELLYDWIVDNKQEHKIEYVLGLGDITDNSGDAEWVVANKCINKLNGVVPYALSRGNHDDLDDFNNSFNNGFYDKSVDGVMKEGDLTNSYRFFEIQGTKYMIMSIDFAPDTKVLQWADKVISSHPGHKVIIITHAYMYRDGTTIDDGDCYPPSYYSGYTDAQNGDDMWSKCFSKHKNVLMVLSGHDPWQNIVYRQDKGVNGNVVTQMLIDPQYMDLYIGSTAMVAMFYFSNDGNTLTVRYYSVEKDCYGSAESQFTIDLDKINHKYETTVTKATLSKNGKILTQCTKCGFIKTDTVIYYPKAISLNQDTYTYNGKTKKPGVTIKNSMGKALKEGTDYTLSYSSGRKLPGKYKVTVAFKGNYTGEKVLTFSVKPETVKGIKLKSRAASSLTLSWPKTTGADGYIVYKYNSKTKKYAKLATVKKNTYKVASLSSGTQYKFKIRAYSDNGGKVYSAYSSVFTAATKPSQAKISSVKASAQGQLTVNWKKNTGADGYQLLYSTSKKFTSKTTKKVTVKKSSAGKYVISSLKNGKTYYIKLRAYKTINGKKVYGAYSKVITMATKPQKAVVTSVASASKAAAVVKWKKVSGATGYQVQYSTSSKFSSKYTKSVKLKSGNTVKTTLKKLKSKKTYYIRVRAYKTVSGKTVYGAYSTAKTLKIK